MSAAKLQKNREVCNEYLKYLCIFVVKKNSHTDMTGLEMMRWILGILITAGALAVTVMYFFRNDEAYDGLYGLGY